MTQVHFTMNSQEIQSLIENSFHIYIGKIFSKYKVIID